VSLLAGGVPCPPFSRAGKQLGADDERDLFPTALDLLSVSDADALMLENVRGLLDARFNSYRQRVIDQLREMGYWSEWRLLQASDFGVPQLRPRSILIALRSGLERHFSWPRPSREKAQTVGEALEELMGANGWDASPWVARANSIAPTLVGGSKKHGGPDLGPTRAKREWAKLGVNGLGIASEAPGPGFEGEPMLTVAMTARLQGFPPGWVFAGGKTAAYRQVGNAFPPPVARVLGRSIANALRKAAAAPRHSAAVYTLREGTRAA
jgi:DNA (cytosine-5)-methyltransferase 1